MGCPTAHSWHSANSKSAKCVTTPLLAVSSILRSQLEYGGGFDMGTRQGRRALQLKSLLWLRRRANAPGAARLRLQMHSHSFQTRSCRLLTHRVSLGARPGPQRAVLPLGTGVPWAPEMSRSLTGLQRRLPKGAAKARKARSRHFFSLNSRCLTPPDFQGGGRSRRTSTSHQQHCRSATGR